MTKSNHETQLNVVISCQQWPNRITRLSSTLSLLANNDQIQSRDSAQRCQFLPTMTKSNHETQLDVVISCQQWPNRITRLSSTLSFLANNDQIESRDLAQRCHFLPTMTKSNHETQLNVVISCQQWPNRITRLSSTLSFLANNDQIGSRDSAQRCHFLPTMTKSNHETQLNVVGSCQRWLSSTMRPSSTLSYLANKYQILPWAFSKSCHFCKHWLNSSMRLSSTLSFLGNKDQIIPWD